MRSKPEETRSFVVSVDFTGDRTAMESRLAGSTQNCWVLACEMLQVLIVEELRMEEAEREVEFCEFTMKRSR